MVISIIIRIDSNCRITTFIIFRLANLASLRQRSGGSTKVIVINRCFSTNENVE